MSITTPDDRTTTYNPVVATNEFAADFPVFDNDDIAIYHDGVERTDFAVSATYVEGISNNAKAVFAVGITGKVQVVGARDPRRTNRFQNGAPLPTRDINLALDTLEGESQEARRDIDRAVMVELGGTGFEIQQGTAGQIPVFDGNGNLIPGTPTGGGNMMREIYDPRSKGGDAFPYDSVADASGAVIPPGIKRIRTQFYAPLYAVPATLVGGAHYRRVSFADLAGYPSASYFRSQDRFLPDGTLDIVNGGYWVIDELKATVTMFGAIGDGTTDDAAAVQAGLTWWGLADNRTLIVDEGKRVLMNSGASINCDGRASPGSIIMYGSVKSAANVAAMFTFTNVRGGRFRLRVYGGGQTADYSQANPSGMNEAFRFVNAYGPTIEYVEGHEYAGRVLRMTSTAPGSGGFRTQWVDVQAIYTNSSAAISAPEATRLAQGVGQSAYIDSGTVAFGMIRSWISMWEKYGPVIRDTTDVTLLYMESLWRSNQGFQLEGVTSFHGGKLNLGSELNLFDVMRIRNGTSADSSNIVIDELLAIGGTYGLRVENVGTIAGPGIKINSLMTRQNTRGLTLSGCSKAEINLHSWDDEIAFESSGTCDNIKVDCKITSSKKQAILVSAGSSNITFTGSAYNGNTAGPISSVSLIDILTTNPIFFEGFIASSGNVDMLYDVPASNNTVIRGGRATVAGGTVTHSTQPRQVSDVVGWKTVARGTATVLSGTSSVVIPHGLSGTPENIDIIPQRQELASWWITARDGTNFTVAFGATTPANSTILWKANVPYAVN